MSGAVDAQRTLGELLRRIHQESVIDDLLTNVTLHVLGGLGLVILIDET